MIRTLNHCVYLNDVIWVVIGPCEVYLFVEFVCHFGFGGDGVVFIFDVGEGGG